MVTHLWQAITDKKIGELLTTFFFNSVTVMFKEYGIKPYNSLVFNEHNFTASKITYYVLFTDNNKSENLQNQSAEILNESHDEYEAEWNEELEIKSI